MDPGTGRPVAATTISFAMFHEFVALEATIFLVFAIAVFGISSGNGDAISWFCN
jgi:hypothetical protein